MEEARSELHKIINDREMKDALLLVFANKQDLPNAMNAAEITDKLGLHSLRQRQWYVQYCLTPAGSSRLRALRAVTVCTRVLNGYVHNASTALTVAAQHKPQAPYISVVCLRKRLLPHVD